MNSSVVDEDGNRSAESLFGRNGKVNSIGQILTF
jgi:hypothetical protein